MKPAEFLQPTQAPLLVENPLELCLAARVHFPCRVVNVHTHQIYVGVTWIVVSQVTQGEILLTIVSHRGVPNKTEMSTFDRSHRVDDLSPVFDKCCRLSNWIPSIFCLIEFPPYAK